MQMRLLYFHGRSTVEIEYVQDPPVTNFIPRTKIQSWPTILTHNALRDCGKGGANLLEPTHFVLRMRDGNMQGFRKKAKMAHVENL
jgi:hypothetical protein